MLRMAGSAVPGSSGHGADRMPAGSEFQCQLPVGTGLSQDDGCPAGGLRTGPE